ncbi:MAG: sulfotransferase family 2 domain-containing protein [Gammaproteobacteria bacterium]
MLDVLKRITGRRGSTPLRDVFIDHEFGFILYTTAKCGSGSAKEWLLGVKGIVSEKDIENRSVDARLGNRLHVYMRDPNQGFCATQAELRKYIRRYKNIAVARNPYSRVVSFYCDKVLKEENRLPSLNIKHRVPYPTDMTFRELVARIGEIPDDEIEPHLRSQAHGREDIEFDHVVKIEHFDQDIQRVSADLGIPELRCRLHRNRTTYIDTPEEFVYDKRPVEFCAGKPPAYPYFFDDALTRQIGERYRKDIEKFDYKFSE